MNEKFEQYISDLSPEMQEKARQCKTKEELNAFIAENDLELPEDALELVAGGCGKKPKCPKCGSSNYQIAGAIYHCDDCGYERHDRFVR